jgi:hypothetical protein
MVINNVEVLIVVAREEVNHDVDEEDDILDLVCHCVADDDAVDEGYRVRGVDARRNDHATQC